MLNICIQGLMLWWRLSYRGRFTTLKYDLDVILGMDWLDRYKAQMDCFANIVTLKKHEGKIVVFGGDTLQDFIVLSMDRIRWYEIQTSSIIFLLTKSSMKSVCRHIFRR